MRWCRLIAYNSINNFVLHQGVTESKPGSKKGRWKHKLMIICPDPFMESTEKMDFTRDVFEGCNINEGEKLLEGVKRHI